jgi:hypothetical protein
MLAEYSFLTSRIQALRTMWRLAAAQDYCILLNEEKVSSA